MALGAIHNVIAPKATEEENQIAFDDTCTDYQQFCASLCGYSAHVLNFDLISNGHYKRKTDNIELYVECTESGLVNVTLRDIEPRTLIVPGGIEIPFSGSDIAVLSDTVLPIDFFELFFVDASLFTSFSVTPSLFFHSVRPLEFIPQTKDDA